MGIGSCLFASLFAQTNARRVAWQDLAPLHPRLEAHGVTAAGFASYVDRVHKENIRRVHEGDLDHLVFYLLQSTRFTRLPPIEPALSARALVDSLGPEERRSFLETSRAPVTRVPPPVASRIDDLVRAVDSPSRDPRLAYFRHLVSESFPARAGRVPGIAREYLRSMRFIYEKEVVARNAPRGQETIAELYRKRGLSTDTAVEAGYLVHLGLGVLKSLEPGRMVRRVLVIGPGLDLAPRTGLREDSPPQSYQPWAIVDALFALGLSRAADLQVVAVDINPRVVNHLRRAGSDPPVLTLVGDVQDSETVTLSAEYRDYFGRLGEGIGTVATLAVGAEGRTRLQKTVKVRPQVAGLLDARLLDIVTSRLDGAGFDLAVATNILPYFDDVQLMLALANVGAMLAPGGVFLHNEPRPIIGDITSALGFPFEQSRHATIATVRGAPPLGDSVWMHKQSRIPNP